MRKIILACAILVAVPAVAQHVQVPPLPSYVAKSSASPLSIMATNASITHVGVHANAGTGFFQIVAALPECAYQTVYIDMGTENGRAAYATVLSAKRSAAVIPWFVYAVRSDGVCLLDTLVS